MQSRYVGKIEKIMNEEKVGFFSHSVMYAISIVYGFLVKLRNKFYDKGYLKTNKLDCKVISVGNVTVGGSGKTPMTLYLAKHFKDKGIKSVILSRGYKGTVSGVGVVTDGEKIFMSPEESGDEPYLMATKLKGVPIIVSKDRFKGGLLATEAFDPQVIILDDGFQHRKLYRDLNIVLVDSVRNFGNEYLVPRGILREPVKSIARADLMMIKGTEEAQDGGFNKSVVRFSYKPEGLFAGNSGLEETVDFLKDKNVVTVSAIAEPRSFVSTVEKLGGIIKENLIYTDHYDYEEDDLEEINEIAKKNDNSIVVTTEKDYVKLNGLSGSLKNIWVLKVGVNIDSGFEELEEKIEEKIFHG